MEIHFLIEAGGFLCCVSFTANNNDKKFENDERVCHA